MLCETKFDGDESVFEQRTHRYVVTEVGGRCDRRKTNIYIANSFWCEKMCHNVSDELDLVDAVCSCLWQLCVLFQNEQTKAFICSLSIYLQLIRL